MHLDNGVRIGVSPSPEDGVLPLAYDPLMARKEREILEHAVHSVAEQAAKADDLVDEARAAGGGDPPVTATRRCCGLSS